MACAFAAEAAPSDAETLPIAPARLEACAKLRIDSERLACYDRLAAPQLKGALEAPAPPAAATPTPAEPGAGAKTTAAASPGSDSGTFLDSFWELGAERKRGTFNFSGYRPNYVLPVHVSSRINESPTSPAPGHSGQLADLQRVEGKLQLSVRTKLFEGLLLPGADLWFGFTQLSLWQLYNANLSRPFRSTDYEPELIYVVPTPVDLPLGWNLKLTGIGLAHQSNGQGLPFSRSWNRVYALAGVEKGQFALTARYNQRIHESGAKDDNPDLVTFRGRTDLLALWSPGAYTLSALWRTNFDTRHGSLQLDLSFPVRRSDPKGLRVYLQAFTGYSETLIDYNFRQTTLGVGLSLFGW